MFNVKSFVLFIVDSKVRRKSIKEGRQQPAPDSFLLSFLVKKFFIYSFYLTFNAFNDHLFKFKIYHLFNSFLCMGFVVILVNIIHFFYRFCFEKEMKEKFCIINV